MITFEEMGLSPSIVKAIKEIGFELPMPVQEKVIPLLLEKATDIIGLAQTGTGKTAAFGLPLVELTDTSTRNTQAVVLCPTRELCIQITNDLLNFAKYSGSLKILPVYGGSSIENQLRELKKGVHIIVATPGRLIDMMDRGAAKLNNVHTVVLDEADEMLNMGFLDSINAILAGIPKDRQTLLFSATMPPQIASIAAKYMNNPIEITVGTKNAGAENVTHAYYLVHAKDKYRVLKRIADFEPGIYGIIFCRTRRETQEIASKLVQDGYNADALHGDLSQAQRDSVMQKFRVRNVQLLVATDVAARGLDVEDLTHVIHYSIADDAGIYTHRSGRTGRAGKAGISISIVNLKEKHQFQQIEKKIKKEFVPAKVPTGREICGKQLFHWVEKIENVTTDHKQIEAWLPDIRTRLEGLDKEELIHRVVALEFNRFLEDYRNSQDITEAVSETRNSRRDDFSDTKDGMVTAGYTRLFINLGKMDGMYPEQLIDLVNQSTPGKKVPLGKIDLAKQFSFFEVENKHMEKLMSALNQAKFHGRKVHVELAQDKDQTESRDHDKPRFRDHDKPRSREFDKPRSREYDKPRSRDFEPARSRDSEAPKKKKHRKGPKY
jgi:ATP-dependent RNA helicase DeaD